MKKTDVWETGPTHGVADGNVEVIRMVSLIRSPATSYIGFHVNTELHKLSKNAKLQICAYTYTTHIDTSTCTTVHARMCTCTHRCIRQPRMFTYHMIWL